MKTKKNLTTFIVLLMLFIITSCTASLQDERNYVEYFWNPPNSIAEEFSDANGNAIYFNVPDEYVYLGLTERNETILKSNAKPSVRCCCYHKTPTSSCEAVSDLITHKYYCSNATIDCGRCLMAITFDPYEQILIGGYIIPSQGVRFAQKQESLPYTFNIMMNYPEFKKQIESLLLKYYRSIDDIPIPSIKNNQAFAPLKHEFVALNAFGRAVITIIPENLAPENSVKSKVCTCSFLNSNDVNEKCVPHYKAYYLHCTNSDKDGRVYEINIIADSDSENIAYQSYSF